MNWMMNRIAAAKEGAATQGLKGLVAHLTSALWADVASLFIWHDAPKELILHTAHGWYRPSEGKASYKIGQGWTGRLAVGNQDVNIVGFEDDELRTEATNPYYENMIPPEHRSPSEEPDARIGIRLKAGDKLVGIISFSYYRENRHLVGDEDSRKYIVNYLTAVIPLITEAVEVAKREANQKQTERLRATKDAVVHKLIEAIDIASGWQPTLDTIRAGFEVERVILYLVKHDRVEFGRVSSIKSEDRAWEPEQPVEPYEALASVIYRGKPFLAKAADEPLLTTWPNRIGIKSLFAVPILSARGEIVGILEMVNRVPTPDHPFEFLAQDECNAAVDVAQSLGVAMEHEAAVAEVRNQLEMANRIGATSLASAIVMHRLMSPLARLRSCIDWLDLQPQRPRDEINSVLTRMQRDCEEAIETIQQTAISGPAERRREDLRGILNQALRVVAPQVSFSRVNLNLTNEFRLPVNVEVFSLVGALVNLLSNAIEAMEQGQTLAVSTQRGLDEKSANLRIHNPGRQYSEKELDEFFKVGHTMKGSQGHLGYGLSIAKRAIEASGGKLILLSPASGGVEARVTLPLAGD
jgi:signal transduction histidine kinase